MEAFVTSLYNFVNKFDGLVYMLVAIVLVAIGIMFIIPSENSKQKAKSALPWVVLGAGLVIGAMVLAKEITGAFAF